MLTSTQTRKSNVQQQASWSHKGFVRQINLILGNLCCPRVLERLRLQQKPLDTSEQGARSEDAQHFWNLCLTVATQRAWTMLSLSETQPHNWFGICDEDLDRAKKCKQKIQQDATIIQKAHHLAKEDSAVGKVGIFKVLVWSKLND